MGGVEARVARQAPQMAISQSLFHQLQQLFVRAPVASFKPMSTMVIAQHTSAVYVDATASEMMALAAPMAQCGEAVAAETVAAEEVLSGLCAHTMAAASSIAEVAAQQAAPAMVAAAEVS